VELISKINDICGKATGAAFSLAKEGVREIDIASELWRVAMGEGADYMKSQMVQAERRSTTGLASPMYTQYKIKNGDMVMIAVWCCYKKYIAGIDRTWVVGEPSKKQIKLAQIELKSLEESIRLAKPGFKIADYVDRVYRDFTEPLLKEAGFTDYNIQAYVGHSYGLQGQEIPILWKHEPGVLKPGMVIHIEPGVYSKDPSVGGIRTADTIVITESGSKNLTKFPRRVGSLAQYC
jgi:Xaa-Pro aminopeptidase